MNSGIRIKWKDRHGEIFYYSTMEFLSKVLENSNKSLMIYADIFKSSPFYVRGTYIFEKRGTSTYLTIYKNEEIN